MRILPSVLFAALVTTTATTACTESAPEDVADVDGGTALAPTIDPADDPGAGDPDSILVRMHDGVRRIHFAVVDGRAIYDGDIDLGLVDDVRARASLFGGATTDDWSTRWTNGVVRFRFDGSVNPSARPFILTQLDVIAAVSPISFVDIGASTSGNYVTIKSEFAGDGGSSSDVGMDGGEQTVTLKGNYSSTTVIHEMLHVIGFHHEQARTDSFLWIDKFDDCTDEWPQYANASDSQDLGLYDFKSIMHYPTGSFCESPRPAGCTVMQDTNGDGVNESWCKTMTRKNGTVITRPGTLSRDDVNALWRMYNTTIGADEADDHFGAAIAIGDFDKDGYDDVAVGAPGEDGNSGKVYLFRGTSNRLVPWQKIHQSTAGFADEAGDEFGAALFAIDVDLDGFEDLVIGAPGEDVGAVVDAGAVAVMRGTKGGLVAYRTLTQSSTGVSTEEAGDRFGTSVAAAAIAGSGWRRTIVVGAPGERNTTRVGQVHSGAVFLFADATDPESLFNFVQNKIYDAGGSVNDRFGAAVAVGDLDVSGNADLAVGAPGRFGQGSVRVYLGRSPLPASEGSTSALVTYRTDLAAPEASTAGFGSALAIGDLRSATTRQELVVGAPDTASASGTVYVYSTSSPTMVLSQIIHQNGAIEAGDRFGASLATGNVDPSSTEDDLAVGAPGENAGEGAASLFRGAAGNAVAISLVQDHNLAINGFDEAGDKFGSAVAIGRVDGIGDFGSTDLWTTAPTVNVADLVVGSPGEAPDNFGAVEGPAGAGAIDTFVGQSGGVSGRLTTSQSTLIRD